MMPDARPRRPAVTTDEVVAIDVDEIRFRPPIEVRVPGEEPEPRRAVLFYRLRHTWSSGRETFTETTVAPDHHGRLLASLAEPRTTKAFLRALTTAGLEDLTVESDNP